MRKVCETCGTRETRRNVQLRPANDGCGGVHDYFACDKCEDERLLLYKDKRHGDWCSYSSNQNDWCDRCRRIWQSVAMRRFFRGWIVASGQVPLDDDRGW